MTKTQAILLMETKVIHFQVVDGWIYVLFNDGTIARKHEHVGSGWQEVSVPEDTGSLIIPTQKNAGIKE